MAHLWCRSLVQGRPHMDVGLMRRAGLVVVRCGGCRWSGQRHYKKHCRSLREASITLKKLLLVVLACAIWGRQWADSMVVVQCDNEGQWQQSMQGTARYHRLCTFFAACSSSGHATESP